MDKIKDERGFFSLCLENQFFDKTDLCTVNNVKIDIIEVGERNTNAGPDLLKVIKLEKNSVVKKFIDSKKLIHSAAESQALIHLYNFYCIPKKCLTCSIGKQLIKND